MKKDWKAGDTFKIDHPNGSYGVVTHIVRTDAPLEKSTRIYVQYHYGLDSKGDPITERGAVSPEEIVPVTDEELDVVKKKRAFQKTVEEAKKWSRHCDTYIHDYTFPICLRVWLLVNRMPAADKLLLDEAGFRPKLFADYGKNRVRVTMASRFGDLGVTTKLDQEIGYEARGIHVEELTNFSDER